jgi:hypothetical protein
MIALLLELLKGLDGGVPGDRKMGDNAVYRGQTVSQAQRSVIDEFSHAIRYLQEFRLARAFVNPS